VLSNALRTIQFTVIAQCKKPTAQTAHLVFADPQAKRKKPKEPIFLPALGQTNNETNDMYIEKRDK
jgi:hypothetical protein